MQTGLYYLNARMYDPTIARFLQEDTYWGNAADPLSLNLYTYCHNEPIMYVDPTGYSEKSAIDLLDEIISAKEVYEKEQEWRDSLWSVDPRRHTRTDAQNEAHKTANAARQALKSTDAYENSYHKELIDDYLGKKDGGTMEDVIELRRIIYSYNHYENQINRIQNEKIKRTSDVGKSISPSESPSIKGTGNAQILTPSQLIIDFKKDYEGFSLTLYDASVGIGKPPSSNPDWTIGWGHKVYANSAEFKEFQNGITKEKAQELFDKDLNKMLNTTFVPMLKKNNIYLTQG
ncbi:MAG: hypothetical protein GX660_05950 [Clostridiaceae bacterium]|nr:hypothetical protein [Clostridiaceae bacterium]